MSTLTKENKIAILEALLGLLVQVNPPELVEEATTGWDLYQNTKTWLEELKSDDEIEAFGFGLIDVFEYAENEMEDENGDGYEITREEAVQILERMNSKADVSIGISWETLEYFIQEFIDNKMINI